MRGVAGSRPMAAAVASDMSAAAQPAASSQYGRQALDVATGSWATSPAVGTSCTARACRAHRQLVKQRASAILVMPCGCRLSMVATLAGRVDNLKMWYNALNTAVQFTNLGGGELPLWHRQGLQGAQTASKATGLRHTSSGLRVPIEHGYHASRPH